MTCVSAHASTFFLAWFTAPYSSNLARRGWNANQPALRTERPFTTHGSTRQRLPNAHLQYSCP
ncbi:hypothetical protein M404DRAFT_995453 [Pisolithus tinctorius Marx 270]|uniref:Uncharacterized protein n=1 Tax=Pisolithus tinctorius Marx 270 TaxID=870435 RepID=A0A0C3P9N2_PISTI|nr:hypothetical protein M404DRAFT_995453 [Pisolithus tinctorius Marx 270]